MIVAMVVGFILGIVFLTERREKYYTQVDMRSRLSVVFLSFIIMGIIAILSVIPVMTTLRDMFTRHRKANMYGADSIGLALGAAEKYFLIASSTLFCVVFLSVTRMAPFRNLKALVGYWVRHHVDGDKKEILVFVIMSDLDSRGCAGFLFV
jgi:uncharacterized membrane protein